MHRRPGQTAGAPPVKEPSQSAVARRPSHAFPGRVGVSSHNPVGARAGRGVWVDVVTADESALDAVRRALLSGGERPFWGRGRSPGFVVAHDPDGLIAVRWRAPRGRDDGPRLGHLEQYAGLLPAAGIRAFVTLSPPEARVVCLHDTARLVSAPATVDRSVQQVPHPRVSAVVHVAGRVLDVVAGGLVLDGPIVEVARQLDAPAGALRVALRELRAVGWVAVRTQAPDRVTVRLERRIADQPEPVATDRRRAAEDAWAL